jgi:hypothetical protein
MRKTSFEAERALTRDPLYGYFFSDLLFFRFLLLQSTPFSLERYTDLLPGQRLSRPKIGNASEAEVGLIYNVRPC